MNNRQVGRRRGRGGQQQRSQGNAGGGRDNGNRIDNRARGNAAQLLEKYKSLASEAQRQGDRVNAEYYHQFADHYFRVLGESRSRFDEHNKRQPSDMDEEGGDYDDDQDTAPQQHYRDQRGDRDQNGRDQGGRDQGGRDQNGRDGNRDVNGRDQNARDQNGRDRQVEREPRQDRQRTERDSRPDREPRGNGQGNGYAEPVASPAPAGETDEAPVRRRGRPRRDAQPVEAQRDDAAFGFDANILPPSLVSDAGGDEPKPKRRRRVVAEDAAAE